MGTIETVGVIGSGQMGSGIAQVCAMAGYTAILWDSSPTQLEKGFTGIGLQLDKMVEKGKLTQDAAGAAKSKLVRVVSEKEFEQCDMVIEAVAERFEVKTSVFQSLAKNLPPHAILTSNTSSISITRLAAQTPRPERFMGMHFMNPVPVMKLVELIRGLQTSDETYTTVKGVCERLGKVTVLAVDNAGFVVNRILCPMINEAIFLVQEGVSPEDIDNAMKLGTNQPMGPLTLADFVGLDTLLYILQVLHRELGEDKYRPCPLLARYVEAGWYGKKSGRGFYKYS